VPISARSKTGVSSIAQDPDLVLAAAAQQVPDVGERDARGIAELLANGWPAGLLAVPARRPASAAGSPLPQPLMGLLERSVGADLSTVRLHVDAASVAVVREAHAHAVTVGEDIALLVERFAPTTEDGRALIAHEVAHVVQQRVGGVRPQFATPGEVTSSEEPIWVSASLAGLRVTSPGRRMAAGEESVLAYLRVVLQRIAPTATEDQVRTLAGQLAADKTLVAHGTLVSGRSIHEGEDFKAVTLDPYACARMFADLDDLNVPIALDQQQRRILELGLAADEWAQTAVAELRKTYSWYTVAIWRAQLGMHTWAFADAVAVEQATPGAPTGRRSLIDRLRPPLNVLDATRLHPEVQRRPAGTTEKEKRDRIGQRVMWHLLWGNVPGVKGESKDEIRIKAIQFYWTAPDIHDAAVRNAEDRLDFLRRLWNWLERSLPAVDEKRDVTQELIKDPGRFTDAPFPSHLEAIPTPVGDLRVVPAHAAHRYRFAVDFSTLFDAFGSYAFRWDVLEWQSDDGDTAKVIRAVEGGHTDADFRRTGRHATSHTDLLAARLDRDMAHARADVQRMYTTLGPAGVSLTPVAAGLFELRTVATGVRTLIDVLTVERGPGLRERIIELPGPGLWVIRAVAVPLFNLADEVHRAPSIAYLPVYAIAQETMADQGLSEALAAAKASRRSRAQALTTLEDLAGSDADPSLRELARELASDPRLRDDPWAALGATQAELKTRKAALEKAMEDAGRSDRAQADLSLLKTQLDAVDRQITQTDKLLDTRAGRVSDYPALATAAPITAHMVTDEGQTVPLALEWAQIDRRSASTTTQLAARKSPVVGVLSDHTHPGAGLQEGYGKTADEAVRIALLALLEGRDGYGRGIVAFRLPSGRSERLRVEASLGSIASEALDDLTTLVTLAALAAAPFTEGASLVILVPVGVVSGVRAGERLYSRYDASTLRWDLQTLQDLVDIASAAVGLGGAIRGAKGGMQVSRIGRLAAVSFDVATNTTGFIVLGVRLENQLREIDSAAGLSDGERRSRRMLAVGGALVSAGMQAGTLLITHAYGPKGRPGGRPPEAPEQQPPATLEAAPVHAEAPPVRPAPAAKPVAPAAKPVAPAAKPVAPAAKPVAPAAEPVAPAAEPVAPAAEPRVPERVTQRTPVSKPPERPGTPPERPAATLTPTPRTVRPKTVAAAPSEARPQSRPRSQGGSGEHEPPRLPPDFGDGDLHFEAADPLVSIPAKPSGAPAEVLEIGAGRKDTNLGLPPEPGQGDPTKVDPALIRLRRTDKRPSDPREPPREPLDAEQPIPPQLHGQDTVIVNNPRYYTVDVPTLGRALRPGGHLIIQGRAEITPGMRGTNPDATALYEQALSWRDHPETAPRGYAVVEVVTDAHVLGGPFYRTEGRPLGAPPNVRIVIRRLPESETQPGPLGSTPATSAPSAPAPAAAPAGTITQSTSAGHGVAERPGSGVEDDTRIRLSHGTEQRGFEGLGGLTGGRIDVAHAHGEQQDLGQGFYLTMDHETARVYASERGDQRGGSLQHVLTFELPAADLGVVVDIRVGGTHRERWEAFLRQRPEFPASYTPPGLETNRALLRLNPERRGVVFEDFLRGIGMQDADTVIAPLGDDVFTGITNPSGTTTQVCIRSQRVADRVNEQIRTGR
jgi:hypothetical protein